MTRILPVHLALLPLIVTAGCERPTEILLPHEDDLTVSSSVTTCGAPPHQQPVYVRPPDDGIALDSLLEGSSFRPAAGSTWVDVAAGNFCGDGGKEAILLTATRFELVGGLTPTVDPLRESVFVSDAAHPWHAIAAANLDGDPMDEIVAVRQVTATGVADVVVGKVGATCLLDTVLAQNVIGGPSDSNWIDVAIGNFDGQGKKIVLLKQSSASFSMLWLAGSTLLLLFASDLDTDTRYPWRAIGAGDLDGDGIDELIAARRVTDGVGTTIHAYKWNGVTFVRFATSTFGNMDNSAWTSVAVGDFNGDGRAAIALMKNQHSNFAVLDLPTGASELRVVRVEDLDSATPQWSGLTAIDWLPNDQHAAELLAVRNLTAGYRANIFVYGDRFQRAWRDGAIDGTKAQWVQVRDPQERSLAAATQADLAHAAHSNTVVWNLQYSKPDQDMFDQDYLRLVDFLEATKDYCVDGKQLRVWVQLYAPRSVNLNGNIVCTPQPPSPSHFEPNHCQVPDESPWTTYDDRLQFRYSCPALQCTDYAGWGLLLGKLAVQYPHLVGVFFDDFTNHPDDIKGEELSLMQFRMRRQAPWLNLIALSYWDGLSSSSTPDLGRLFDTFLFFFRNNKRGMCLADPCGQASVWNAPDEIADVTGFLPAGRKLQVGTYWGGLSILPPGADHPTNRYDYDLMRLLRNLPALGGVLSYPMQAPVMQAPVMPCDEFNFVAEPAPGQNDFHLKFCTLQRVFGEALHPVTYTDLTATAGASGGALAAGDPSAYEFQAHGLHNVLYRGTDGNAYELFRTASNTGFRNLSAAAIAPQVTFNIRGYVFEGDDTQHAVYKGSDGHIHDLRWTLGAVLDDDLTVQGPTPPPANDPFPYVSIARNTPSILYRTADGAVHRISSWRPGPLVHESLTALLSAPAAVGTPFGFAIDASTESILYRGRDDHHLHEIVSTTIGSAHQDLSGVAGAPDPDSDPRAFFATSYGYKYAFYRRTDVSELTEDSLHDIFWSPSSPTWDDVTAASHCPTPVGTPTGYFTPADGTHHIVYRSFDDHLHKLSFTVGGVADDDLTLVAGAPFAAGDPTAYVASDGTQRVTFRSFDGHLYELVTH